MGDAGDAYFRALLGFVEVDVYDRCFYFCRRRFQVSGVGEDDLPDVFLGEKDKSGAGFQGEEGLLLVFQLGKDFPGELQEGWRAGKGFVLVGNDGDFLSGIGVEHINMREVLERDLPVFCAGEEMGDLAVAGCVEPEGAVGCGGELGE